MDIMFNLRGSMTLEPVWWKEYPHVSVFLDQDLLHQGPIFEKTKIPFARVVGPGKHKLEICFYGKTDSDTDINTGKDKAVVIKDIEFFGITSPRFVWSGIYRPVYPTNWASQQTHVPPATLTNLDYLGWNGTWCLEFEAPIFTWIHQIENLGWLYDQSMSS